MDFPDPEQEPWIDEEPAQEWSEWEYALFLLHYERCHKEPVEGIPGAVWLIPPEKLD